MTLVIGLSSWIMQDGNDGDFSKAQQASFAIEFSSAEMQETAAEEPRLTHLGEVRYDVVAQVIHATENWWALDIGIGIFQAVKPPIAAVGRWLTGEILLGVEPFSYFDILGGEAGAPPLIYDWQIESIEIQTSPLIETRPRMLERDPAKLGWREIESTNAWDDDEGLAEYLLHCRQLDTLPRRKR